MTKTELYEQNRLKSDRLFVLEGQHITLDKIDIWHTFEGSKSYMKARKSMLDMTKRLKDYRFRIKRKYISK